MSTPTTSHTDRLRNPNALEAASLSADVAIRGELTDRLMKDGLSPKDAMQIAKGFHARVVRIDETQAACGRPHHGFALLLMVDRTAFKAGNVARGVLEELTESLINTHKSTCREALLTVHVLSEASKILAIHPNLADCATLEVTQNCTMFGPSSSTPISADGKGHERTRSVLFATSINDLLTGINTHLKANRQINLGLHEGRTA